MYYTCILLLLYIIYIILYYILLLLLLYVYDTYRACVCVCVCKLFFLYSNVPLLLAVYRFYFYNLMFTLLDYIAMISHLYERSEILNLRTRTQSYSEIPI
jgi:hypothetical protein